MGMNVKSLAIVILGEESGRCKTMYDRLMTRCSTDTLKPTEIVTTALIRYTVDRFTQVLQYNDDPEFVKYFSIAQYRLILAVDTKSQDFLDRLVDEVKTSGQDFANVQILRLSDVVVQDCKKHHITNICVQRAPSAVTTDLLLEQRLAERGVYAYQLSGGMHKEIQRLCDSAIQEEREKHTDAPVFEAFWNAWRVVLTGSDVRMILLDNCSFPSSKTRPPYMEELRVINMLDLYTEAAVDWVRQHIAHL